MTGVETSTCRSCGKDGIADATHPQKKEGGGLSRLNMVYTLVKLTTEQHCSDFQSFAGTDDQIDTGSCWRAHKGNCGRSAKPQHPLSAPKRRSSKMNCTSFAPKASWAYSFGARARRKASCIGRRAGRSWAIIRGCVALARRASSKAKSLATLGPSAKGAFYLVARSPD